jgi:hypothetical protein
MKKSMIFFDSLCSLIRAVSTLMKYYVQLRWRERESERERERMGMRMRMREKEYVDQQN